MSTTRFESAATPQTTLPQFDEAAVALAFDLRRRLDGEVRFDPGSRHLYATDASNFRQVPTGVVVPRHLDDVVAAHEVCRAHGAAITSRGGGTSLAGQACNAAVILDCSKYLDRIEAIDLEGRTATVQPGVVLDSLVAEIAPHQLTWGPRPSTHNRCTIGGMLGNNACGSQAFRFGRTQDNVQAMEVLLPDGTRTWVGPTSEREFADLAARDDAIGELYAGLLDLRDRYADVVRRTYPDIPRRVSGFNLEALLPEHGGNVARALVGTEGTCVTILRARLQLHHAAQDRVMLVLGYEDVYAAGDAISEVRHADGLYALEGIDQHLIDNIREKGLHAEAIPYLPEGGGWLLCEFGADDRDTATALAEDLQRRAAHTGAVSTHLYTDPADLEVVWKAREAGLGASAHFEGDDHWPGWEDSAVHPDALGDYLRELRELLHRYGYEAAVYGHFGDGCVHSRIDFDLTSEGGIADYRSFLREAAELVVRHEGSLSGEHGDGQQRGPLLEIMYGPELVDAFREFSRLFDPDNRMNPGKVVDSDAVDDHLRLGADFAPWHPDDQVFAYPDDGDFAGAQLRCVGVGTCRRDDGSGTMCPSYMVTHEEQHSTRGRARLLFEMLQPDSELDGWQDTSVKQALDLCLSCKGCVADCPVNVDIPTYKAEFLHHHYDGRLHPRAHYALGLIQRWSALARWMPGLANRALATPGLGRLLRWAGGIAPERPAPGYAARTFRDWFADHEPANPDGPHVILFPDTFVDHFEPGIGQATVRVLEDAGYRVRLPERRLCCGRPLYDYGFLDLARDHLDAMVDAFRADVADGVRIVGMEPSCVAVFRDELVQMYPDDPGARALADATMMLGEFLTEVDYDFPTVDRRALVHGHCHHKGALGMEGQNAALDALGLDWEELDAGCCGLAGSFGFEAGERYDVSVAAGERKLLPAVREADDDTLLLSDGFSCRTQVEQLQQVRGGPGRRMLHLAEVIELAHEHGRQGPPTGTRPEDHVPAHAPAGLTRRDAGVLGTAAALLVAGWWWARR